MRDGAWDTGFIPHAPCLIPHAHPDMIQRPQTVYLFLGAGFLALFAALTFEWLPGLASMSTAYAPITAAAAVLAAVVALVAVFLYKDRKRQRTVIGAAQVLALLALVPLLAGLFLSTPDAPAVAPDAGYGPYLLALVPLVAFILLRMARRGVDRDIATIRSMDRLR